MNQNQYHKMICKLREHVVTDEGDFVPAGTPVQIAGWADGDNYGKIEVRTLAYMWCDTFSMDAIENGRDGGCVGSGLWLAVSPENLQFSELVTQTQIGGAR